MSEDDLLEQRRLEEELGVKLPPDFPLQLEELGNLWEEDDPIEKVALPQKKEKQLRKYPPKEAWKRWYAANRQREKERLVRYRADNLELCREAEKQRAKIRYKTDQQYRLRAKLRSRLWVALRRQGIKKNVSVMSLIGCSLASLKMHLESLFEAGMSWDNYGEWHIDHKIPFARYDLTDSKQVAEACHFSNLQPLWAKDNLSKGCS